MGAITTAVTLGHQGETARARQELLAIWEDLGVLGDSLHRCTLAHYLADLYPDPAEALIWDVRALDAASALTDHRAGEHHAGLEVAGFYPSLHLNIAATCVAWAPSRQPPSRSARQRSVWPRCRKGRTAT